ncbi:MAG: hypothetical protein GX571_13580 [Lentisphaerae bacterium]|jgi:DUF1680 family protein|nr:hypothetical protein [Lentisphaerota bacterium]
MKPNVKDIPNPGRLITDNHPGASRKTTKRLLAADTFAQVGSAETEVHLTGPLGARLGDMIENQVIATDVDALTQPFAVPDERHGRWQSEFWGKYMHSAVPFRDLTGDARLAANIERGLDRILAAQVPDGYIGNYVEERRAAAGRGWDVWGMKYTMMGLIHYCDGAKGGEKSGKALAAAKRLCDYLIAGIGLNGRRGHAVWQTGSWSGMPSSSVLEPVMWLYNRTEDEKYLDFATFIVKGLTEPPTGPRLVDLALKGIPVGERNGYGWKPKEDPVPSEHSRLKAYEMMSCYQGLVEYWEVKRRREKGNSRKVENLLRAAVATVKDIARTEVNLAGGCSSVEEWFHGAEKQHLPASRLQETCVTITWMRLLEKLLAVTVEPWYADEFEKTFYNAYLAALRRDGGEFAAYTPLNGSRSHGMDHCHLHTNCCNANGPRGFLAFLRALIQTRENTAFFNFYASGTAAATLPASGRKVTFDTYTHYPKDGFVRIVNRTPGTNRFTLALRIPAWSAKTTVTVDGKPVAAEVRPGAYCLIERDWTSGDGIDIYFDLATRIHRLPGHVAFTRGPVALARDTRFADGPLDEPLREVALKDDFAPMFTPVRSPGDDIRMAFAALLPLGVHSENPDGALPSVVRFCDYASAANLWRPDHACRLWLPAEIPR